MLTDDGEAIPATAAGWLSEATPPVQSSEETILKGSQLSLLRVELGFHPCQGEDSPLTFTGGVGFVPQPQPLAAVADKPSA